MGYAERLISLFEVRLVTYVGFLAVTAMSGYFLFRAIRGGSSVRRKTVLALALAGSLALSITGTVRLVRMLKGVPRVLFTDPGKGSRLLAASPDIRVRFSAPVVWSSLVVNTNPPTELTVRTSGLPGIPLPAGTAVTLVPKTTLPPGTELMVYFSDMKGPFTEGYGGEQLLEFNVDDPAVSETEPGSDRPEISPSQEFRFKLFPPLAAPEEWTARSDPDHPLTLEVIRPTEVRIRPDKPFRQGSSYRIMLIHTPRIINRTDASVLTVLEPRIKSDIPVTVVKPVFVSSFTPNGNAVNPSDPLSITFDQPMDTESLTDRIAISPSVSLTTRWDRDTNTLRLSHDDFQKNTEYTVTLLKGIRTERGGTLEENSPFSFHTAGPLTVTGTKPGNSDRNVQADTPLTVTFDQDVPESVTDHIRIEPETEGSYTVSGKTVVFKPKETLKSDTEYSVTIDSGTPSVYGLPSSSERTVTFKTVPDQVLLAVPFYKQQTYFTCNIAAARMLLAYRSVQVTERELIDKIGLGGKRGSGNPHVGYVDDFGTFWEAVIKGVTAYRGARLVSGSKLTEILTEVKKGNPVMTWGQNGWSDPHEISWTASDGTPIKAYNGMHSVVVRGFVGSVERPTLIYVNDPWRGQYTIGTEEFMRRWRYYGMAMVIE